MGIGVLGVIVVVRVDHSAFDIIDDRKERVESNQIGCEQATLLWTGISTGEGEKGADSIGAIQVAIVVEIQVGEDGRKPTELQDEIERALPNLVCCEGTLAATIQKECMRMRSFSNEELRECWDRWG